MSEMPDSERKSESRFTFKDIACHIWACDGFIDGKTAEKAAGMYTDIAGKLKVANNQASRNEAIKTIVDYTRQSQVTTERIIVYGGFRRGQNAPEHMWIEYDGKIYETMPNYELYSETATAGSRQCPQLENFKFPESGVGSYATYLTENHKAYLASRKT